MADLPAGEGTEQVEEDEVEVCDQQHLDDLDDQARAMLSTFTTIRSKIDDLARAESDLRRFELSIEQERKRLSKQIDSARQALRNARIQMGAELTKVDGIGFSKVSQMIKDDNHA